MDSALPAATNKFPKCIELFVKVSYRCMQEDVQISKCPMVNKTLFRVLSEELNEEVTLSHKEIRSNIQLL
jgi:hypothetical protein